jgi:hypothetical protein
MVRPFLPRKFPFIPGMLHVWTEQIDIQTRIASVPITYLHVNCWLHEQLLKEIIFFLLSFQPKTNLNLLWRNSVHCSFWNCYYRL